MQTLSPLIDNFNFREMHARSVATVVDMPDALMPPAPRTNDVSLRVASDESDEKKEGEKYEFTMEHHR